MAAKLDADDDMDVELISSSETETPIGSTYREDQQDLIEHYATMMPRKLISDLYSSAPDVVKVLRRVRPFDNKRAIIQVFGGREISKRTLSRTNCARRAASGDTLGDLPVRTRPYPDEEVGHTIPETDRFIESWAPWKPEGERLLMEYDYLLEEDPMFADEAPDIARYPHAGEDTEAYMVDTESETDMGWE